MKTLFSIVVLLLLTGAFCHAQLMGTTITASKASPCMKDELRMEGIIPGNNLIAIKNQPICTNWHGYGIGQFGGKPVLKNNKCEDTGYIWGFGVVHLHWKLGKWSNTLVCSP